MVATKTIIESFFFPYFYIDYDSFIKQQSNVVEKNFLQTNHFLDLIPKYAKDDVSNYLFNDPQPAFLKTVVFDLHNNEKTVYLYKRLDEYSDNIHIICFNSNDSIEHIWSTIKYLKEKLTKTRLSYIILDKREPNLSTDNFFKKGMIKDHKTGLAHEIRNSLTAVRGFLQLLKPNLTDITTENYANIALDEISRTNEIIHNFLQINKQQAVKNYNITLSQLLKEITTFYKYEVSLHSIELVVQQPIVDATITIDSIKLKQVIDNLVKNAIESIKERSDGPVGTIKISTKVFENKVAIIVNDNGNGIHEDIIDNLFKPFYTTKKNGTGIGLTICKEIVEENGGNIEVASDFEQGTTFKILLPIYNNETINCE